MQARLSATDLACRKGDRLLFRQLDLDLGPGDMLHVRGPNGVGKTSLMRLTAAAVLCTGDHDGRLKVHGNAWAASHDNGAGDGVLDTFHDIPLTSTAAADMSTNGQPIGYYLIEIGGIDKIKFTADVDTVKFYAACSTFSMS